MTIVKFENGNIMSAISEYKFYTCNDGVDGLQTTFQVGRSDVTSLSSGLRVSFPLRTIQYPWTVYCFGIIIWILKLICTPFVTKMWNNFASCNISEVHPKDSVNQTEEMKNRKKLRNLSWLLFCSDINNMTNMCFDQRVHHSTFGAPRVRTSTMKLHEQWAWELLL